MLWMYTCNRGFQPKLMGLGGPVSWVLGWIGLKSNQRWEEHFRSWNQHVQRPRGRRKLPMKNPKDGLPGWYTEHRGSVVGDKAGEVRRRQMWRESFLFSGHFHRHALLRAPPCVSKSRRDRSRSADEADAQEGDLPEATERKWESPNSPLALNSCSLPCTTIAPPVLQSKLSLLRAPPSNPKAETPGLTAGRAPSSLSGKGWRVPESLTELSPVYCETRAGILWAQTSLVGKGFGMIRCGWTKQPCFEFSESTFPGVCFETQKTPLVSQPHPLIGSFHPLIREPQELSPYLYAFLKHNHSLCEMASPY